MRYLHENPEKICDYVRVRGLVVSKCHSTEVSATVVLDVSAIEAMDKKTETLWGTSLPYYLFVSPVIEDKRLLLRDAVADAESWPSKDRFLLVAYQDGGLISASGMVLPFQEEALLAEWWAPGR
jgi:hypothetical protein